MDTEYLMFCLYAFGAILGVAFIITSIRYDGMLNHRRIRNYIEERGGKVVRITWAPFGTGWYGNQSHRIYRVVYRDAANIEHQAYCKTAMYRGVYLTGDTVTRYRVITSPDARCPKCDYNLTGNTSGQCPECGAHFEPVASSKTADST